MEGGVSIWKLPGRIDVSELADQLEAHPEIWNRYTLRTKAYGPHSKIDDIWVRFRRWDEVIADPEHCCDQHASVFYPEASLIPAVFPIVTEVLKKVGAMALGGVLITRVSPGGRVDRHVDRGWHAEAHRKIAVQIAGNQDQAFCFDDTEVRADSGEIYEFLNARPHWVVNDSGSDRITMIICVR